MQQQRLLIFSIISVLICSAYTVSAQQDNTDEEHVRSSFERAVAFYDNQLGKNSMLYTGGSYYEPYQSIKGHQFFREDYWEVATIEYNGHRYDSIYIKYDIYTDVVLIENFNSDGYLSPITLYSPHVHSFDLMGYYFIRLKKDSVLKLKDGFYNQMYKGENVEVLVKRRKEIVKSNEINSVHEKFTEKDRYYIKKDGRYHQVKKKGSILKVLEDRKKEIKSFIKEKGFYFKDRTDVQLVEVATYYDSLL